MSKYYPIFALLLFILPTWAMDTTDTTNKPPPYFDPALVDYKKLLPNPPVLGSPEAKAELDLMVQIQAHPIDPVLKARVIKEANKLNIWLFADQLGPWFNEKNLPMTTKLMWNVDYNEW